MADSIIAFEAANFAVDRESRTISGTLLPFGEVSRPARDPRTGVTARFTFSEGSITLPDDPGDVVLTYGHDSASLASQVGIGKQFSVTPAGIQAKFGIARTPNGDQVLALSEDKILRSFSAEVDGEFVEHDGIQHARATNLTGASVVPKPAFAGAHITSVAASAAQEEGTPMENENTVDETPVVSFTAEQGTALMAQVQSLSEKIAALEDIKIPVGPGTAQFQVTEESIYRFAGSERAPSGFDFAEDLLAAGKNGDQTALERLKKFTAEHFGPQFSDQHTTTTDTAAVNPSVYRPDMFLGQAPVPASPLYDFFHKGGVDSVTPFFWSKLDRGNTDVGVADHTEDTAQDENDLVTASGATVTPAPVSGRAFITREVADQGGNPQVSGLIWSEFDRSFRIALETKTAALVAAASVTELGASITAGETNGAAAGSIVEAGLVGLQFLADGFRFQRGFGHIDLYKLLAGAEEMVPVIDSEDAVTMVGNGKKIYPILNPSNADGTAASKWSHLSIGGYDFYPAASLGATNTTQKSYICDPQAVHVWNSGLTRLDKLQETVEGWQMAVWGYFAGIVYDVTGLRKITFDVTA